MEQPGGKLNWPGLLRWSLENSDGTRPTAPADKERLQFLHDYMEHLNNNSVSLEELLVDAAKELQRTDVSEEAELAALKVIDDCVDNKPDLCRHLHKFGALEALVSKSSSSSPLIALNSLRILAYCLSNNPELQSEAVKLDVFEILYESIKTTIDLVGSPAFPADLFRLRLAALSSLVCHNRIAEQKLMKDPSKGNGAHWLSRLLDIPDSRIQLRAAGLVRHCIAQELVTPQQIMDSPLPTVLAELLRDPPSSESQGNLQFIEVMTALHNSLIEYLEPISIRKSASEAT